MCTLASSHAVFFADVYFATTYQAVATNRTCRSSDIDLLYADFTACDVCNLRGARLGGLPPSTVGLLPVVADAAAGGAPFCALGFRELAVDGPLVADTGAVVSLPLPLRNLPDGFLS
jgi:hypothetical protein